MRGASFAARGAAKLQAEHPPQPAQGRDVVATALQRGALAARVIGDSRRTLYKQGCTLACTKLRLFERAVSRTRMPEQGAVDVDNDRASR
jgi:hypothetical protein